MGPSLAFAPAQGSGFAKHKPTPAAVWDSHSSRKPIPGACTGGICGLSGWMLPPPGRHPACHTTCSSCLSVHSACSSAGCEQGSFYAGIVVPNPLEQYLLEAQLPSTEGARMSQSEAAQALAALGAWPLFVSSGPLS